MDPIPRERMGNATSLFNLMRNLGGSIGIATTGTLLARKQQAYVNVFGAHVDAYSPRRRTRSSRRGRASSRPAPIRRPRPSAPTRRCSGWCSSRRRWCAFVHVFRLLGIIFLLLLPLVLLMRRPRTGRPVGAH